MQVECDAFQKTIESRSPASLIKIANSPLKSTEPKPSIETAIETILKQKRKIQPAGQVSNSKVRHSNLRTLIEKPVIEKDPVIKETTVKSGHVKKPLNAFMLFLKDARVTLNDSDYTNSSEQIKSLSLKWHSLSPEERESYFEMAKAAKQKHIEKYPQLVSKFRRRRKIASGKRRSGIKKCRATFGLEQQNKWCKMCKRKKKCLNFETDDEDENETSNDQSERQTIEGSFFIFDDNLNQQTELHDSQLESAVQAILPDYEHESLVDDSQATLYGESQNTDNSIDSLEQNKATLYLQDIPDIKVEVPENDEETTYIISIVEVDDEGAAAESNEN